VQNTIDRIVFLRIAEDRYEERYGTLQDTLKKDDCYKNLLQYFYVSDEKYNSGQFDFDKDHISTRIVIDLTAFPAAITAHYARTQVELCSSPDLSY